MRKKEVKNKLEQFKKAKLIITDRLHGMIFAAITSTPCIALGNYNHKIKSCSETLEHLGYIKYVDNVEEIDENIKYLMSNEFEKYDNKCCRCGWSETNPTSGKIPLQIHHIDGDYKNNSEDNLELLCPNCHALTPTFGALNRGNGRDGRHDKK